jgi:hypothetical protein
MRAGFRPDGRFPLALLLAGGVSLAFGCSLVVKTDDLSSGGGALDQTDTGAPPADAPRGEDPSVSEAAGDDAGLVDDSTTDRGEPGDATSPEVSAPDGAPGDAGAADTAPIDTGSPDTAVADTSAPDTGFADTGGGDTGPPSACASGGARVFVTSSSFIANLGGIAGADQSCTGAAAAAGIGGTWNAWLSDSTTSALNHIYKVPGPAGYVLMNGTTIAPTWSALVSKITPLLHPINITEKNALVSDGQTEVWTGTDLAGSSPPGFCRVFGQGDWTSISVSARTPYVGHLDATDATWSDAYAQSCDRTNVRLYCFERCP